MYPMHKKLYKKSFKFLSIKSKKNSWGQCQNESAREKKLEGEYWFTSSLKIILLKGSMYVTLHNCLVTLELELHNLF